MWFPRGEQEEKEGRLREVQDSFWLARRRKKFNRIASSHTPRITIIFSPSLFSLFLPPALSIYGRNGDNTTSIQPSQPPCFSLSVLVEFLGVGLWGTELKGEGCRGVDIYFLLLLLLFFLHGILRCSGRGGLWAMLYSDFCGTSFFPRKMVEPDAAASLLLLY